ncbi:MAG: CDP-2,3-bis-(O-geranylgeranyl)-sn-glycerol synthase [Thermoplasmata archaeon]|nr:CDP-2,3-bis-(O-geranylgeranyl)-sn-glycerol synthase [Thermoplasmata archaeon]
MFEIIWQSIWWILPAYIANGSAVLLGGGTPIDFNKKWRGKPIFGKGKTWRGFIGGGLAGVIAGIIMNEFIAFDGKYGIVIIASLSFGALLGDLFKSFIKRRIGKERGEKWIIADQLDFLVGAFLLCYAVSYALQPYMNENWFTTHFTIWHILFLLIFTPFLHLATNILAYLFKYKEVPW